LHKKPKFVYFFGILNTD